MTALDAAKAVLALLFVLGLIGALAWGLKRAGALPGLARSSKPGKNRRLTVTESLSLDTRHRLVLIRRDKCEHLLLLGPAGSLVVESDRDAVETGDLRREPTP